MPSTVAEHRLAGVTVDEARRAGSGARHELRVGPA
jgi:hypothetical protein